MEQRIAKTRIEEDILFLRKRFPALGKREMYDIDAKGNEFCEICLPNESMPRLPITVTLSEKGCRLSVGHMSDVTGEQPISVEHCAEAIEDVLSDRIIFVFGYRNEDDRDDGKTDFTKIFAVTGGEDDMSGEYEAFVNEISTPRKGLKKLFSSMRGIFDICNFSGSVNMTVARK